MKKGTCIYFNGCMRIGPEPNLCDKKVDYRKLVGGNDLGWAIRTPCFKKHDTEIKCDLYKEPTKEQIAEFETGWDKAIDRMLHVLPLLAELKKENPKGGQGQSDCPICNGKLNWSISSFNMHGHLVCENDGCINMIE